MEKKKYEKLNISVEEFDVIHSISSCNTSTTISIPRNCAPPSDDNDDLYALYFWFPEVFTNVCEQDLNEFPYYSYCYHTPTGTYVIFAS